MRFVHKNGLDQVLVILRITQAPVEHRDRKHGFCDRTLQHVIPASPSIENAAFHEKGIEKYQYWRRPPQRPDVIDKLETFRVRF